jgi:hypothetical protein
MTANDRELSTVKETSLIQTGQHAHKERPKDSYTS